MVWALYAKIAASYVVIALAVYALAASALRTNSDARWREAEARRRATRHAKSYLTWED
jgi:hypothetical protein